MRRVAVAACQAEATVLAPLMARQAVFAAHRQAINPPAGMPMLEKHRWALERMPSEAALHSLQRDLERLAASAPDERQNRVFVALLADSFRSGRDGQPGGLIEVLLHDLVSGGFPPVVVADALRGIRGSARYFPSIAEILDACRASQRGLETAIFVAQRVAADRRAIVAELARAVPAPELADEQ
jgi:hypothetical protein